MRFISIFTMLFLVSCGYSPRYDRHETRTEVDDECCEEKECKESCKQVVIVNPEPRRPIVYQPRKPKMPIPEYNTIDIDIDVGVDSDCSKECIKDCDDENCAKDCNIALTNNNTNTNTNVNDFDYNNSVVVNEKKQKRRGDVEVSNYSGCNTQ